VLRDVEYPTFSRQFAHTQMVVRLSALCTGRPLPPGRFPVLIAVRGWADPRAIVWLEGVGQLKNPMTSSGIKTVTFQLIAW
jgi:hypothetical protein